VYIFLSGLKMSVIIKKTKLLFLCIVLFTITNGFTLKRTIQALLRSDDKEHTHYTNTRTIKQ
jgi:hypothetical protein